MRWLIAVLGAVPYLGLAVLAVVCALVAVNAFGRRSTCPSDAAIEETFAEPLALAREAQEGRSSRQPSWWRRRLAARLSSAGLHAEARMTGEAVESPATGDPAQVAVTHIFAERAAVAAPPVGEQTLPLPTLSTAAVLASILRTRVEPVEPSDLVEVDQ